MTDNLTVPAYMLEEMGKDNAASMLAEIMACVEKETGERYEWKPDINRECFVLRAARGGQS